MNQIHLNQAAAKLNDASPLTAQEQSGSATNQFAEAQRQAGNRMRIISVSYTFDLVELQAESTVNGRHIFTCGNSLEEAISDAASCLN